MAMPARTGRAWQFGLAGVAITALLYPVIAEQAGHPLTVFLLAPLGTAVVADHRDTRIVGLAAVVAAALEGLVTGPAGWALAARLSLIGIGVALAMSGAARRTQRERQLVAAQIDRTLSATFQQGLVPVPAPPPGIAAATCYRPASAPLMLGGDFVDVIALPDGSAGFVIGDVCGHGPTPAAFGTRVRAGWKSLAWVLPTQPARWLEELDRAFFLDGRFDGFVTVIAGRMSSDGEVTAVCAGHPRPLLIGPEHVDRVDMVAGLPLGIDPTVPRQVCRFEVPPGSSMLLYTDGLIENPGTPGGRSSEKALMKALPTPVTAADLDQLMDCFGPDGFDDDVALLLLGIDNAAPSGTAGRAAGRLSSDARGRER
jgi:hypothetical protein